MITLLHGRHSDGDAAPSPRDAIARDWPIATTTLFGGEIVDLVAVGRRLEGETLPLHRAETRFAVVYGTHRLGMSAHDLAGLLGLHQRVVTRIRSEEASNAD
ncbi:hypothetical protein [Glycomyces tenuis]|uniref:hypothetical protein n=1 Tax=Glycomyces tenuis TaxID=58116 RepID=UPI0003F70AD4|nr:hypothetical protein [Glycomyces tenuis]